MPKENVKAMKIALKRTPQKTLESFFALASYPLHPRTIPNEKTIRAETEDEITLLLKGLNYLIETNFYPSLHLISCPALVMAAEEYKVVPFCASKALYEKLPSSDFEIIKNNGHIFPLIAPDNIREKILKWITKISM